jgi:hypothetical protein
MKREFQIEKGFQIVVFFLMDFWWKFLKEVMINKNLIDLKEMTPKERESASKEDKAKDDLHYDNSIVFTTILGDPVGPGSDFEKVIEQRMHIPPSKQHDGLIVKEEMLFQLTIDFCNYFNRTYQKQGKDSLRFAINWLEDMRKHPEKHKTEWEMWEKTIEYVYSPGQKHLIF